jgi:hypothetical protein
MKSATVSEQESGRPNLGRDPQPGEPVPPNDRPIEIGRRDVEETDDWPSRDSVPDIDEAE